MRMALHLDSQLVRTELDMLVRLMQSVGVAAVVVFFFFKYRIFLVIDTWGVVNWIYEGHVFLH